MRRGAISFVSAAVLLAAMGCGDETDTDPSRDDDAAEDGSDAGTGGPQGGRDGGSSNAGGDGGVSRPDAGKADEGDQGGDAGTDDPGRACDAPPEEDYGECTEAEVKAYAACIDDTCGDKVAACYGSGHASGKAGGVCKSYVECTNKCECDDTACFTACQPSAECAACQEELTSCAFACLDELACATGGDLPGDPSKTCEDLASCCTTLADAEQQAECNLAYEILSQQSGTADLACSFAIEDYCP